jgi:rhamnose utilization protein RhaD (predicted bifunctional aldolase and dehydrogenase)
MKDHLASRECVEVARLRELSASIGRNPLLVQASTGNTSVKVEGTLWMKASGKWFAHADQDDFFVDLDVSEIQEGLRQKSYLQSLYDRPSSKLARGSIETTMHATLPFPVVVHVHSLNTLAWAVRADGEHQLSVRLKGLNWQWLPYVPSGLPLALEIERVFSLRPDTNVFVLSNHGLVVCSETCDGAQSLLEEVEQRLTIEPRPAPAADYALLDELKRSGRWQLPEFTRLHTLATDPDSQRILAGGFLYPCQAMFLPTTCPAQYSFHSSLANDGDHFWIVDRAGVLIREDISRAELEMLIGLAEVVERINPDAPLSYLTEAQVEYVLGKEASQYLQLAHANGRKYAASS